MGWNKLIVSGSRATLYDVTSSNGILVSGSIRTPNYIDFLLATGSSVPAQLEGRVYYDKDEQALTVFNGITDTSLQVGQETVLLVRNNSGVTINNGDLVMITGTIGNSGRLTVAKAVLDGSVSPYKIIGVATNSILNGADGLVTSYGKVKGIDTSGFSDGDVIYANSVNSSGLSNVIPNSPNLKIEVGIVIHSHASNGILFVELDRKHRLSDLYNVTNTSLSNGDLLILSGSNVWINSKTLSGSYILSGSLNVSGSISSSLVLPDGQFLIGNTNNISTPRTISGDITFSNTGVGTIKPTLINDTTAHESSLLNLSNTKFYVSSGSTGLNRSLSYNTLINNLETFLRTGSFTGSFTGSIIQTLPSANIFVGNDSGIASPVSMTGDITILNTGVTTIGSQKVVSTMLENSIVNNLSTYPTNGPLDLTDVKFFVASGSTGLNRRLYYSTLLDDARTRLSTGSFTGSFTGTFNGNFSLPSLSNENIWIGNGSNIATAVAPSGDWSLSNTGIITTNNSLIQGKAEITELEGSDEFLVYDSSVSGLRRVNYNNLVPSVDYSTGGYTHTYTDKVFVAVTHSLNTVNPIIQVYNEVSELFIPENIKVSGSNHVLVTLSQTGSGYVVVQKPGNLATNILGSSSYATTFSGQTSITVNHNLDTEYPFVQVYNSAGYMIVPGDVLVLNNNSIRVDFPVNTLSGSITVAKSGHVVTSTTVQNAVSASYADYIQSPAVRTHTIPFGISSPIAITTGAKGIKTIGREGKIIGWRLVSDVSTTATLDIWKTNSAIPTNSNSICGSSKPSLTAGTFNSSTTLTGWTDTFTANDVFRVEVESNNNSNYLLLELDFLVDND